MNSNWPSPTDYGDALQHPERALYIHEDLREGEVEMNKLRRPKGRSGNFAIVYKVTGTKGPAAIKVFKNPEDDRQRRYQAISSYLDTHRTGYTVGFEYFEHGIYLNSNWFPALRMEWVEGDTLGSWLVDRVKKKDTALIKKAADEWIRLVEKLQEAKIAHGDLQHGNILVVKGKLKLVDYDGMCVPGLRGSEQMERGLDGYQHRLRKDQKLGSNLDNFSAWLILVSLRAIAADPGLHDKYKKRPNDAEPHENLLFVVDDLHADNAKLAPIWADLKRSPDPEVRDWASNLWECLDKPFEQIPPFVMDPHRPLRAAVAIRPYDWDQIARLSKSLTRIPKDCEEAVAAARKRVDCRDRLKEALDKGDTKAIATLYDPKLLDDWDACKDLIRRARQAGKHQKQLAEVAEAARNLGDGRAFIRLWNEVSATLAGVADARRYEKLADEWGARIRVSESYLAILSRGAAERQIADAWKNVEAHAPPHPDISPLQQDRGRLALRRVTLLGRIGGITTINEESDKQLKALWTADLFDGCTDDAVTTIRKRVADALQRLEALNELKARIATADRDGDEATLIAAASRLPADYADAPTKARIALARDRHSLGLELQNAVASESDRAIKTVWHKAKKKLSAQQLATYKQRCELAERRCQLLDELEAVDPNAPADVQDEAWESTWKQELLDECTDAQPLRARYELAVRRRKAWRELSVALQRGQPGEVRVKAADKVLAGYPPMRKKEALIAEFIRKADDVDRILAKLEQPTNGMPLSEADLAVLRTSPELFGADARSRIEAMIAQRLRTSLKLTPIDEGYEIEGDHECIKLQWSWPDFALISNCYVDVNEGRHAKSPTPKRLICSVDDHRRAVGGMRVFPTKGETCVTIWPVVNLGWKELLGQPLFIGPIDGAS